jgi:NADH:ubiquinone oxidoreductase subunit 2 (subunit N)
LLGSSFLDHESGSLYFNGLNLVYNSLGKQKAENLSLDLIDSMLVFIFLNLFSKLARAPFHLWALDVYEESPTSSSFNSGDGPACYNVRDN